MSDPDFQNWVGRERTQTDPLTPFPARALAAALARDELPADGDALPLCWHWLYFHDTPSAAATGADGHPKVGDFLPPVSLPRRMWAAGALQVERPLRLGLPATRVSRIRSIERKAGKSGELVFVTVDHRLSQDGRDCIREEQNLVYREAATGMSRLPAGELAPLHADWRRDIVPDPVLLFRYSALTYNAHRIHYDREYATTQEFYPALVVHGPLLATLLLNLLDTRLPDARIAEFRFRAVRPTFDRHPFTTAIRRDGDTFALWTADHEGQLGMSATAKLA